MPTRKPRIVTKAPVVEMAPGPIIPRRYSWLDVPGYEGVRVRYWANATRRCLEAISSKDDSVSGAALLELIVEHNGWCDPDGTPYPPASEQEFWAALTDIELARAAVRAAYRAAQLLPN